MAKMTYKLPEETLKKLNKLGNECDGIVQKMLVDGIEPLQDQIKSNLEAVIGHGNKGKSRSKGNLIKAVKVTKAYQIANGDWHIKVGIYGYDSDGIPNALKAVVLEHGRSGMPAKPWLKPAINASKKAVVKAMSDRLDKETK